MGNLQNKGGEGINYLAPTTDCRVVDVGGGATSGNCTSTNTWTIAQENGIRPMLDRHHFYWCYIPETAKLLDDQGPTPQKE